MIYFENKISLDYHGEALEPKWNEFIWSFEIKLIFLNQNHRNLTIQHYEKQI